MAIWSGLCCAILAAGCHHHTDSTGSHGLHALLERLHQHHHPPRAYLENPLFVPQCDREFVWRQLVDTVEDYFPIEREVRIREIGDVITEGRIETYPTTGSTCLEPWRKDSTKGIERLWSTLQSVRRRCTLWITPTTGGYLVKVAVERELEDLDRPEQSTVGGASLRHDGQQLRAQNDRDLGRPVTLGWIPAGRDVQLEQRILSEIRGRLEPAYAGTTPAGLAP